MREITQTIALPDVTAVRSQRPAHPGTPPQTPKAKATPVPPAPPMPKADPLRPTIPPRLAAAPRRPEWSERPATASTARSDAPSASPPNVEITIDSVEIHAIAPGGPMPERKGPVRRGPSLSLADYLSGKEGRR